MRYGIAKWMPIPETDNQARINPRLFIAHSIIAPWEPDRTRQYWNERGVNLESHFGLGYSGSIGQFVDTAVRADANMYANNFAISVETASNTSGSDPWNNVQVESLINLMVYAAIHDNIKVQIASRWDGEGFGYHRMFPQWSDGGTNCPGTARVKQFHEVVFPEVQRRVKGTSPTNQIPVFPGRQYFYVGAYNEYVTMLDRRLIAKGFTHYNDGDGYQAGPRFTEYTRLNVAAFQRAQGWSGSGADGFPGPVTWQKLFS